VRLYISCFDAASVDIALGKGLTEADFRALILDEDEGVDSTKIGDIYEGIAKDLTRQCEYANDQEAVKEAEFKRKMTEKFAKESKKIEEKRKEAEEAKAKAKAEAEEEKKAEKKDDEDESKKN
jgi:hypothetical protein